MVSKDTVNAFVPPHPNWEDWISVEEHRKQDGLDFSYDSNFIHPELCRYTTATACEEMDYAFYQYALQNRQLVDTGTIRVLVLLLQWADHSASELLDPTEIEMLWNSDTRSSSAPSGSISSYFRINSYGGFHLEAEIVPWKKTNGTEEYYANLTYGLPSSGVDARSAIEPILEQLDEEGFDWSRFDRNNDGMIDSLVVLHSGYNAELGGKDCLTGKDASSRIWTHSQGATPASWRSTRYDVGLGGYTISSAYYGTCGMSVARIGVLAHELLHTFSLPFLYNLSTPRMEGSGMGSVGSYDIMSNPYGPSDNAMYPGMLSPWSKMKMGWLDPLDVPYDGVYLAGASAVLPHIYKISHGFDNGKYLLIENRQPVLFDSELWAPSGLLVWYIDDTRIESSAIGYMDTHNTNLTILQADGLFELDLGSNNGDSNDFWREGMEVNPSDLIAAMLSTLDESASGGIPNTSLVIKIRTASKTKMRFEVTGLGDWSSQYADNDAAMTPLEATTSGDTIVETVWGPMLEERSKSVRQQFVVVESGAFRQSSSVVAVMGSIWLVGVMGLQ